jgi:hypothetical protein
MELRFEQRWTMGFVLLDPAIKSKFGLGNENRNPTPLRPSINNHRG